jgi:CheY-like chemotaxis protein
MARILVVDDDALMRRILHDFLVEEGYEVLDCGMPEEALAILGAKAPDLALIDYSMPGMTGAQLFTQLRALESTRLIPVIFLTGTEFLRFAPGLPVENNVRFMSKPVEFPKLQAAIADLLGGGADAP